MSASCKMISRPAMVIESPNGTTENAAKAGTADAIGASVYTMRSAVVGRMSSFRSSLMPSAMACRIPHGPALFGPMRDCMSASTLRSAHTTNARTRLRSRKTTRTFAAVMPTPTQSISSAPL
jgi:hypothetical protein